MGGAFADGGCVPVGPRAEQDYAAMVAEGKDALRTSKTDLAGLAIHVQTT